MKYKTLGVALYKKCTAQCDICCFSCTQNDKEHLDIQKIKKFISNACQNKDVQFISITGGEPFIEYNFLRELILFITKNGKMATCITNGFWANDFELTFKKLTELKKCGLVKLGLSHDKFHKQFVDTNNICNI